LDDAARKVLLRREPTLSDRLGTQSFVQKLEQLKLPGAKVLAQVLRNQLD
jgi:hypothetical protein